MNGTGDSTAEAAQPYDAIREIDEIREKKQKPKIGHELGFGAPCLVCEDKCPGLDLHFWRKICKNCRCPPWDHDIENPDLEIRHKIGRLFDDPSHQEKYQTFKKFTLDMPESPTPVVNRHSGINFETQDPDDGDTKTVVKTFEWIPHNVSETVARKYFQDLPIDLQPIVGTPGADTRSRLMNEQLPSHDQAPEFCDNLTDLEADKLNSFVQEYKTKHIGVGQVLEQKTTDEEWVCKKCNGKMMPGQVAVFTERAGTNVCWHPHCFKCKVCNDLLVDLIYFWKDGDVYCGRHYGNLIRPRCAACDELIFAKEYTQAEEHNWHNKHFCCWNCDSPLGGQQYVAKDNHPFCLGCYELIYAKVCATCKNKIAANSQRFSHYDFFWHASAECFRCGNCNKALLGQPFLPKQGHPFIFCSKKCKNGMFPRQTQAE